MKKLLLFAALVAALPMTSRADEPQKLTADFSGWVVWNSFRNEGQFDARELPRFAFANAIDESAYGMTVRQSRLRALIGIPADGLLGGATLKAFVEADFMGGGPAAPANEVSTVFPRLRHYYVTANWKQVANLTLLVGQSWGIAPGPYFASSLTHLAVPRFAGAGFLYRRAPEVKASIEAPAGDFAMILQAGALTPGDFSSNLSGSAGNAGDFPDLEARLAGAFRPGGKQMGEVGLWAHYGREKYEYTSTFGGAALAGQDATTDSQGFGVDVKFDLPYVSLIGGAFTGGNLDALTAIAGQRASAVPAALAGTINDTRSGVVIDPVTGEVHNIKTQGAYAQLIVSPLKGLQVLGGAGFENPRDDTLALPGATSLPTDVILRNTQYNAGAIYNVTSKWRVSLEFTRYVTKSATAAGNDTFVGNQFEIGSLLAL